MNFINKVCLRTAIIIYFIQPVSDWATCEPIIFCNVVKLYIKICKTIAAVPVSFLASAQWTKFVFGRDSIDHDAPRTSSRLVRG